MSLKKCLFFFTLAACVWAQKDTGTISGAVRDVTVAVAPRASITVTNAETNITFRTVTGEGGSYTAPALRPGEYLVTAELAGFKKEVRRGVILQVNQVAVIDRTLQVGDVAEITEVREAASLIQTQSVTLGDVGTAAHMSPEPADRRADIWAFSVVLAEMLARRQLYTGETIAETLAAVIMKDPGLDGLPGQYTRCDSKAAAALPRQRPQARCERSTRCSRSFCQVPAGSRSSPRGNLKKIAVSSGPAQTCATPPMAAEAPGTATGRSSSRQVAAAGLHCSAYRPWVG